MLSDKQRELISRAHRSTSLRDSKWRELWENVWTYISPDRIKKYGKLTPDEYYKFVHDSTAAEAAKSLANVLVTGLFPPWLSWSKLIPGPLVDPKQKQNLAKVLEPSNRLISLELNKSNFIQEIQPSMDDLIVSTGVIVIEPNDDSGVRFKSIPLDEVSIEENEKGDVDTIFHDKAMSNRDLLSKYGSKFNADEKKEMNKAPEDKQALWLIVTPSGKKFSKTLVLIKGEKVLDESELDWNPYIVFRWSRNSGEPYGVGPAMRQYFDIRWLNKLKELAGKGIAMDVGGIYTALDDGVVDAFSLRLQPFTVLPVMSNDTQNPSLNRLNTASNVNVAQFEIEKLRQDIKRGFFADRFSPVQGEKFTATEVIMRSKLIAQEIGAPYAILERELLRPVMQTTIKILISQGKLNKEVLPDSNTIETIFISSLAQAQRLTEVEDLVKFVGMAGQLSQFDPQSGLVPNVVSITRRIGELLMISPEYVRSDSQVKDLLAQAQAEKQRQEQQLQQQEQQQPPTGSPPSV